MTNPASDELIERLSTPLGGMLPTASGAETAALIARIRQQDAEIASMNGGLDAFMRALKDCGVKEDTVMFAIARAALKGGEA